MLDYGNAQGAADRLAMDLYQTKGDRYAQDHLLSEISRYESKGIGADLYLNNWNPVRGTWDTIDIVPNDGTPPIPMYTYDWNDPPPWGVR